MIQNVLPPNAEQLMNKRELEQAQEIVATADAVKRRHRTLEEVPDGAQTNRTLEHMTDDVTKALEDLGELATTLKTRRERLLRNFESMLREVEELQEAVTKELRSDHPQDTKGDLTRILRIKTDVKRKLEILEGTDSDTARQLHTLPSPDSLMIDSIIPDDEYVPESRREISDVDTMTTESDDDEYVPEGRSL